MILVGFMGSGKSTILNALSKSNVSTIDLDAYIEHVAGMSIRDIFATKGEAYFRNLEVKCLIEVKDSVDIVATGGGIVTTQSARNILMDVHVVWLDAPFDVMYSRIMNDVNRPLASDYDTVRALYNERKPLYDRVSDVRVNTSLVISDAVIEVMSEYKKLP